MSCKYYEEKEFICGWKDQDTPYYYKGGVCMGQKGAPRVWCKGDEDQCENLDHRRAECPTNFEKLKSFDIDRMAEFLTQWRNIQLRTPMDKERAKEILMRRSK